MPGAGPIWAEFLICAALIGGAGLRLTRCADALAVHTGLSRSWIGLVGVATVTSLPELVTGISAVTLAGSPDMAVGDVLGSCALNLALLACADLSQRDESLWLRQHRWSALLGALLLAMVAVILRSAETNPWPNIGHVSLASVWLLASYLAGLWALYRLDSGSPPAPPPPQGQGQPVVMPLRQALLGYCCSAALILAMGIWLPQIGLQLAASMAWSHGFTGTMFIAGATSLPEIATTWGALRIRSWDMVVGNLLGSNLFDVLILAVDDAAHLPGSIFAAVGQAHVWSAGVTASMSLLVAVAFSGLRLHFISLPWRPVSVALLVLYVFSAVMQRIQGD